MKETAIVAQPTVADPSKLFSLAGPAYHNYDVTCLPGLQIDAIEEARQRRERGKQYGRLVSETSRQPVSNDSTTSHDVLVLPCISSQDRSIVMKGASSNIRMQQIPDLPPAPSFYSHTQQQHEKM